MKVCMFVLNNCKRDARVLKEAKTLTDAGHEVRIIAILDSQTEPFEQKNGFRIIRVVRNPIHFRIIRAMKRARARILRMRNRILRAPRRARARILRMRNRVLRALRRARAPILRMRNRILRALRRARAPILRMRNRVLRALRRARAPILRMGNRVLRAPRRARAPILRMRHRILRALRRARAPILRMRHRIPRVVVKAAVPFSYAIVFVFQSARSSFRWLARRIRLPYYKVEQHTATVPNNLRRCLFSTTSKVVRYLLAAPSNLVRVRYLFSVSGNLVRCLFSISGKVGRYLVSATRKPLKYVSSIASRLEAKFYQRMVALLMIFARPSSFIDYYFRSWEVIKDEPADVYHCHDLSALPIGYMAKRRIGGKLFYDSHELFTEIAGFRSYERPLYRLLERYLIHRADEVIIVCQSGAEVLSAKYGIPLPKVVMNCPPKVSLGEVTGFSLRQKLGLSDEIPIILYSGGFIRGRALHNLILSAPYLEKGKIVFLGWGTIERELRNLVKSKMLEDRILFAEPVPPDQVVGYTNSASLGVAPFQLTSLNNYYATPNKLFEYIGAGLPVVGSNFPEIKRVIEGYHLGKTFDPEDPKDIAAAINWVLSNENRYNEMRKNAMEAAKIFNWENESKKLLAIYQRLSDKTND